MSRDKDKDKHWDIHCVPIWQRGDWVPLQFHITGKNDPISRASASRLADIWRKEMLIRGATGIRRRKDTVEPIRDYMSTKDGSEYSYISTGDVFIPHYLPKNYSNKDLPDATFVLPKP